MKTKSSIASRWFALTLGGSAFFLAGPAGWAVTLTGSDGPGLTSFNTALNWSDLLAPSGGSVYSTSTYTLNTPASAPFTFQGAALSVELAGGLAFTNTQVITVNTLRLNGGTLSDLATSGTATLAGAINVQANSNVDTVAAGRTLAVNSAISDGSGGVSASGLTVAGAGTLTLNGFQGYTSLTSNGGITNLNRPLGSATAALPTANTATLTANAMTNIGTSQRLGALNVGATGVAALTPASGKLIDTQSLSIAFGGQVDLTASGMVVRGATLASVTALITSGLYNGANGYWDGPGLVSSTAANDGLTALGVIPNGILGTPFYTQWPVDKFGFAKPEAVNLVGGEILVKYTYWGDADLNGVVDPNVDSLQYQIGLNDNTGTLQGWLYGDFDYSGGPTDTGVDLNQFLIGLFSQGVPLVDQGGGAAGATAVPEPGICAALLAGALMLSARRRRGEKSVRPQGRTASRAGAVFPTPPGKLLAATLLALALADPASHARELVTLKVQAVQAGITGSTSPGVDISPDGGSVGMGESAGQVVLQLVAILHGLNASPTDESFTRTDGSWITFGTGGGLSGSLRAGTVDGAVGINNVSLFQGIGADSGLAGELSGAVPGSVNDGILDFGGTLSGGVLTQSFAGYFTASASAADGAVGGMLLLGETILSLDSGTGGTTVRYVPRFTTGGFPGNRVNLIFKVDGVAYLLNGDGTTVSGGVAGPDAIGYGVVEIVKSPTVPEPSAFTLLLPGLLGLASRRRRQLPQIF